MTIMFNGHDSVSMVVAWNTQKTSLNSANRAPRCRARADSRGAMSNRFVYQISSIYSRRLNKTFVFSLLRKCKSWMIVGKFASRYGQAGL
jgi:hypothetical protein